jgi:putative flippase GtrA
VAVILLRPGIQPLLALVISSGIAMFFSYFGIRFAAFRQFRRHE